MLLGGLPLSEDLEETPTVVRCLCALHQHQPHQVMTPTAPPPRGPVGASGCRGSS